MVFGLLLLASYVLLYYLIYREFLTLPAPIRKTVFSRVRMS
jgi:hypothetical protein